jgi:hypothetical protein
VLAHLRACADMWGNCIVEIIAHDHPTLWAINPRTWINTTDYREQLFQHSLDAFMAQRAEEQKPGQVGQHLRACAEANRMAAHHPVAVLCAFHSAFRRYRAGWCGVITIGGD